MIKRHLQRIDCMTEGIVYLISYRGFFKRFRFAAKRSQLKPFIKYISSELFTIRINTNSVSEIPRIFPVSKNLAGGFSLLLSKFRRSYLPKELTQILSLRYLASFQFQKNFAGVIKPFIKQISSELFTKKMNTNSVPEIPRIFPV